MWKTLFEETLGRFFLGGSKVSKSLNLFLGFFVDKVFVPPSSTSSMQKILSEKMYRLGGGAWTFFSREMCWGKEDSKFCEKWLKVSKSSNLSLVFFLLVKKVILICMSFNGSGSWN